MDQPPRFSPETARAALPIAEPTNSYVDWPAILAGAVFSTALAFVFVSFGSGLGLSMVSLEPGEGASLRWLTIAAGLWFIWVGVSSFAAGGYLTGRLRRRIGDAAPDEVETRDGAHGVLVWATGALLGAILATTGGASVVGTAARTAGAAAGGASALLEDEIGYYASTMVRSESGATELSEAAMAEITMLLQRSLRQGEVAPADSVQLARIVATETGIDPAAAQVQVDAVIANAETARQAAIEAGKAARTASVIASFVVAATLMVSAAAAYFAATIGGKHRDENLAFRSFGR